MLFASLLMPPPPHPTHTCLRKPAPLGSALSPGRGPPEGLRRGRGVQTEVWPTGPRPIRSALRGRLHTSPVSTLAVTSVAAQGRHVSGLSGSATRSPTHSPPHTHMHTSPSRQSALRRLVGPTPRAGVTVWQGMGTAFGGITGVLRFAHRFSAIFGIPAGAPAPPAPPRAPQARGSLPGVAYGRSLGHGKGRERPPPPPPAPFHRCTRHGSICDTHRGPFGQYAQRWLSGQPP